MRKVILDIKVNLVQCKKNKAQTNAHTFLRTKVLSAWDSSSSGVGGRGLLGALPELEPDPAVAPGLDMLAVPSGTTPSPAL